MGVTKDMTQLYCMTACVSTGSGGMTGDATACVTVTENMTVTWIVATCVWLLQV